MRTRPTLISHRLCPYVQRVAIVLAEKGLACERIDIDLGAKPDWFLALSPLGRTPVLVVEGRPLFESAVICDYLDELADPRLHPDDPFERAVHRAWIEYGSTLLQRIAAFYRAPDLATLRLRADELRAGLARVEAEIGPGPYFDGPRFTVVDAAFAPMFRYFEVFETLPVCNGMTLFAALPKLGAWRSSLAGRPSVRAAVGTDYAQALLAFLGRRDSVLAADARKAMDADKARAGRL